MKDKPLVSILSPCYNVEIFLPQCLDSIINQTYTNLQIVLIDDGSKDNTWRVLQDYASRDSRIEIYHQENQGVASTRNNLLDKVKGDYVLFVDSDDWIELDMVHFLIYKLQYEGADMVMCGRVINDAQPQIGNSKELVLDKANAVRDFLKHDYFVGSLWNKLVKVELLTNIKFDITISYGEDALFCWQFLQRVNKVIVTNKQFYHYRMNETSISHVVFGEKKMTGYYVWKKLTEETAEYWPQYIHLAKSHRAVNAMFLLRDAAHTNYKKDTNIKLLQKTLRNNLFYMVRYSRIKPIWFPYAILVSVVYKLGKII